MGIYTSYINSKMDLKFKGTTMKNPTNEANNGLIQNIDLYNKYLTLLSSSFIGGIFLYIKVSISSENICLLKYGIASFILVIMFTMLELSFLIEGHMKTKKSHKRICSCVSKWLARIALAFLLLGLLFIMIYVFNLK